MEKWEEGKTVQNIRSQGLQVSSAKGLSPRLIRLWLRRSGDEEIEYRTLVIWRYHESD
jgi:uncharacterized DUF497 family protein